MDRRGRAALTFLLSAPPFSYPVGVIGLFGLPGAIAAQRAGRLHDRGWSVPASGIGWVLALVSLRSVVVLVVAVVLLDVAIQSLNILNSTRLFAVAGDARSRVNTVTANFVAGAIGSAGGWAAVTLAGLVCCVFGLGGWAAGRRGPLVVPRPR